MEAWLDLPNDIDEQHWIDEQPLGGVIHVITPLHQSMVLLLAYRSGSATFRQYPD
jgi:hypothetical protein